MAPDEPIRVLLGEPSPALRARMLRACKQAGDIKVMAETHDLAQVLQKARELSLDVIVINDYIPPMDNGHASVTLRREDVQASILSYAETLEPELIQHSFRHGVNGFMHIEEIDKQLVSAVHRVCRGERYYSPRVRKVYFNE